MDDADPYRTQRAVSTPVAAELEAAGLEDAQEIGHGGFGVVYRCVQTDLDRTVAVKVLTAILDEENRARFFREQQAMGRLTGHPNIVPVLQVGVTATGRPYIVMPYHPQDSLQARIRDHGPLPVGDVLRLGVKLAGAVETAHTLGILHRDVKPANILLSDYGEPALADFGIAHVSGGFETATGTVTGSPAFTAPEVLAGDPPTDSADIYGLGATLFCALTGHAAFERRSDEQLVAQFLRITTQPVPNLREQGIPDRVAHTIERAMSANPHDRPSAVQLGDDLRAIQLHEGFAVDDMALHGDARSSPRKLPIPVLQRLTTAHTVGDAKTNIRLELTSFVGRRNEVTEVKNLLSRSRLVTLTGIGGVGKTRLALRVATTTRRDYADGVWLVELGELRDELLLVDMVAASLGLGDHSARPLIEVLTEFLMSRELLLLLDNCEHIVAGVAGLAETLLQTCPGLRILATSRESLDIGGESTLRVPPLGVPDPDRAPSLHGLPSYDAVTLFAERAAAAVPGFELTEDNARAVAGICHRLDGLPLPIELAATRLRAMSPEQILARLTDRYRLLTRGSRGAPSRQQTLRLCIDWSYELCTPQEQQLWSRLSVFAGSCELDAVEQVCGTGPASSELLDVLSSLVDKSVVIRMESGSAVCFRLLETLREYGREKLGTTGESAELRRRHRDWYQQLTAEAEAEWISSRQLEWIARLEREQANLREAMEFCVSDSPDLGLRIGASLLPFWLSRSLLSEGRYWLGRVLAGLPAESTVDRIKALYAGSVLAELQGDLSAGAALVEEGSRLAEQTTDAMSHAYIAYADGLLALFSGDPVRACSRLDSARAFFGNRDDASHVGVLHRLGMAHEQLGHSRRAMDCYEQILAITRAQGESMYQSFALWAMGDGVWRHGDTEQAVQLLEQSLELTRQVNTPRTAVACLETLGSIAADTGDAKRAVVLMAAADELGRTAGSPTVGFPHLLVAREESEQSAYQALGKSSVESARREGRRLGFHAAIAYALGERLPDATGDSLVKLTKRERQVAELIAEGLTNRAIAARLVISPRTAQGHVEHVLTKLGFTSRAQIAAWIVEQGRQP
ncbi:protein kinase domain-containing protein [Rhodococcus opacus]|uniref:Putative serine/threonine protein kinase n=1 Tax=Rhodococcus opacus (strain B4) TaxID=632772 RepID=C1B8V5_RHOOB|nr:protein kinase [Rhodococcus opacus]BAH52108.1 putative serine/threonine protein kinase [Rhodococcus opacus B4]